MRLLNSLLLATSLSSSILVAASLVACGSAAEDDTAAGTGAMEENPTTKTVTACPDGFDPAPRDIFQCAGARCVEAGEHVCKFGKTGGIEGKCTCIGDTSSSEPPACPDGFDPAPRDIFQCAGSSCIEADQHVCKFGNTGGVEGMCSCIGN